MDEFFLLNFQYAIILMLSSLVYWFRIAQSASAVWILLSVCLYVYVLRYTHDQDPMFEFHFVFVMWHNICIYYWFAV